MRRFFAVLVLLLALVSAPLVAQPFSRVTILDLADIGTTADVSSGDYLFVYDGSASTLKRVQAGEFCVADGVSGGQTIYGGTVDNDDLSFLANSADASAPRLELKDEAGTSYFALRSGAPDSAAIGGTSTGQLTATVAGAGDWVTFVRGDTGVDFANLYADGRLQIDAGLEATGDIATDACVRLGDADADTNGSCVCRDAADRLYSDLDCDATRDAGEPLVLTEYDPDMPPVSCATCDEWTGDTETLSGSWANQDAASYSITLDGLLLTGEATGNEIRGRCYDPPSSGNTDFTEIVRVTQGSFPAAGGCGILFLTGGTLAAPTQVRYLRTAADANVYLTTDADFDLAAGAANSGSASFGTVGSWLYGIYFKLVYDNTGATVAGYASANGLIWRTIATGVAAGADPSKMCLIVHDDTPCQFDFLRARTDADRANAGE